LVLALLDTGDEQIVATALRALTAADAADDVPLPVVRRVGELAASEGVVADSLRSEAMSALSASGEAGVDAIRGLASSERLAPQIALDAARVLADHDPQGAALAAVSLIPAIAEARNAAAAAKIAARALSPRLVQGAIDQWQASHPTQVVELEDELHRPRSRSGQEALGNWEAASGVQ
jgi:hypothetical protein